MRFALASFAAATLALAQPHAHKLSINPVRETILGVSDWGNLPATPSGPDTNAKRFAMNLPPLAPRVPHRHPQRAAPHRLGSRVRAAPRAQAFLSPLLNQKCNILVKSATEVFGYISPSFNGFGEYGPCVPDQASALEVSFSYSLDSPSRIDLTTANSQAPTLPFMGGISGFASTSDDFGPGSSNYAYVGSTGRTPPGSRAVPTDSTFSAATSIPKNCESLIWVYDPDTQAIAAQWINTDGSAPATSLVYANDDNQAFVLTGDVNALRDTFGASYPEVTFTCVPPAVIPSRY
ncbi:hypothetical protein FRC06_007641 [Ceratobasidium sp. 370]|nr:hypothetical protein FRC06_007641 [Ceratobasidium sp. 370]